MFTPPALCAFLLATAAATAGAASTYSRGRMAFCGRQPCLPPNRCQDVDGVSVCVRSEAPQCFTCPAGFGCALVQDVCVSLPCHPKAYCVRKNPCGDCGAGHFCQMLPTPLCRPVVQPTCENKICASGEICSEAPDAACTAPPCPSRLVCSAASEWYQVASGLAGHEGSGAAGGSASEGSKAEAGGSSSKGGDEEDDD